MKKRTSRGKSKGFGGLDLGIKRIEITVLIILALLVLYPYFASAQSVSLDSLQDDIALCLSPSPSASQQDTQQACKRLLTALIAIIVKLNPSSDTPAVVLTEPAEDSEFDRTADMLISWKIKDAPYRMLVIGEVTLLSPSQPFQGTASGGAFQVIVPKGTSSDTQVWEWGLNDSVAGTYSVRLQLQDCLPGGCHLNPNFPGVDPTPIRAYSATHTVTVTGDSTTIIHTNKGTSLAQVGNNYYLYAEGTTNGPRVVYGDAPVTVAQFPGWTPFSAMKNSDRYNIVWRNIDGTYVIWNVTTAGVYTGNAFPPVPAGDPRLTWYETVFNEDLDGDGTVGVPIIIIHTNKGTSLAHAANTYYLYVDKSAHSPITLTYQNAPATVGQFPGWTPLSAVKNGNDYNIAWSHSDGRYVVWSVSSWGAFTGTAVPPTHSQDPQFLSYELIFAEDLNGDGRVGFPPFQEN